MARTVAPPLASRVMVAGGTGAGGPSITGPAGWKPAGGGVTWRGSVSGGSCDSAAGAAPDSARVNNTHAPASLAVGLVRAAFPSS